MDQVSRAVAESTKHPWPCRVCGAATYSRGAYVAADQSKVKAPEGKQRFLVYALCLECATKLQSDPGLFTLIEEALEAEVARQ